MISHRRADILDQFTHGDNDVIIKVKIGLSFVDPTKRFFVMFDKPICTDESRRQRFEDRLGGILQAKSYEKHPEYFLLSGFPTRDAAEANYWEVFKMLRYNNDVLNIMATPATMDRNGVKNIELRIVVRG